MASRFQLPPHIFDHARLRYDSVNIVRRQPFAEIQDGDHNTGSGNNFSTVRDGVAIPTFILIFSTMPDSDITLSMLPDVAYHLNSKWRPPKPEMEMTIERNEFATRL